LKIAADRHLSGHEEISTPKMKTYIQQITDMLELFYTTTKNLEGDSISSIAEVVPTVLNLLFELERPMVRLPSNVFTCILLAGYEILCAS
jgi:hypothetical protein